MGVTEEWIDGNGHVFSDEQVRWLEMIRDHIGTSLSIEMDDLDNQPFSDRGESKSDTTLSGTVTTGHTRVIRGIGRIIFRYPFENRKTMSKYSTEEISDRL